MDLAAKQAELDALTWYHEFDFGNGLHTKTHSPQINHHRDLWHFLESHLAAVDFRGKSVLDIGTWDGHWSFYAERRGARSVLASDDLNQNWSQGRGIHLAKELFNSSIEIDQKLSVYDLASRGRKFDVILFLGVYYHLHDPFQALTQIRHCCHPETVVVIDGPVASALRPKSAAFNFSNHGCEWLPTIGALEEILQATYFKNTVAGYLDPPAGSMPDRAPPPGRLGWRWRLGACLDALRGSRHGLAARLDKVMPKMDALPELPWRRVVLTCTPHEEPVESYTYPPPFGLHAYDPRFRSARLRLANAA